MKERKVTNLLSFRDHSLRWLSKELTAASTNVLAEPALLDNVGALVELDEGANVIRMNERRIGSIIIDDNATVGVTFNIHLAKARFAIQSSINRYSDVRCGVDIHTLEIMDRKEAHVGITFSIRPVVLDTFDSKLRCHRHQLNHAARDFITTFFEKERVPKWVPKTMF